MTVVNKLRDKHATYSVFVRFKTGLAVCLGLNNGAIRRETRASSMFSGSNFSVHSKKSYDMTIQMRPHWQYFYIILFIFIILQNKAYLQLF